MGKAPIGQSAKRNLMSIKYHFRNTRLQIVERRIVVIIM
jgi:hypothetical protein